MFAQLVGLFGTALFFASYQCRDNRQLFRVQFLSYLCYTAHLFLLGAATGAVSYLINTFRSFCLSSRYDFLRSRAMGAVGMAVRPPCRGEHRHDHRRLHL